MYVSALFITMDSNSSDVHIMGLFVPTWERSPQIPQQRRDYPFSQKLGYFQIIEMNVFQTTFFKIITCIV